MGQQSTGTLKSTMFNILHNNKYIPLYILVLIGGSNAAVSKLVLNRIDSFQNVFYIFLVSALAMTLILFYTGKARLLPYISFKAYLGMLFCGIFSYFYYFLLSMALETLPAVEASTLNYTYPVFIVLFAMPLNNEKITAKKTAAVLMGFFGALIITTGGNLSTISLTNAVGDLYAIGAAASWGLFSNLAKRINIDPLVSNYIYIVEAFVLSLISVLLFSGIMLPDIVSFPGILWESVGIVVIYYLLWDMILKRFQTSVIANFTFLTPFISLLYIMLLLKEKISMPQVLGLLVIITGIYIQNFSKTRRSENSYDRGLN